MVRIWNIYVRTLFFALAALASFSACSPAYVMRSAYEHSKVLLSKKSIDSVISDPATSDDIKHKLLLVQDAREFAQEIGLAPGNSYTSVAWIDREAASWVVAASRKDAFSLYQWWFPVVGSVPYKGFFTLAEAEHQAKELEAMNLDVWLRPTEAFSTLGWFNDPVYSTMLKNHPVSLAITILHESFHSTVWVPDQVAFNETAAQYFACRAAIDFFKRRLSKCQDEKCTKTEKSYLEIATRYFQKEVLLSRLVATLYASLDALYNSSLSFEQKLSERETIFSREAANLKTQYPDLTILKSPNNAEIMAIRMYLTDFEKFDLLFASYQGDLNGTIKALKDISDALDAAPFLNPFSLL